MLSSVRTPRENPQHLPISLIRIHIERTVIQRDRRVLTRHFPQTLRNIHMPALTAILRAENHERALVSAIPIAAPASATPLAAAPAAKHRSVDQAVVPKLKHGFPSVRTPRKTAQRLRMSLIPVHLDRTVIQPERPVLTRHFPQPLRNIHMPSLTTILRAKNHVLASVIVPSAIPAAVPVFVAPVAPSPAAKRRSVDHTAVAKFKHPFPPVWTPRKDPQLLGPPMVRICVHRVVADPKTTVPTPQVLHPRSDVHVPAPRAIFPITNNLLA